MKWIAKITSAFRTGIDGVKAIGRRAASLFSLEEPEQPAAREVAKPAFVETPLAQPVAPEILPPPAPPALVEAVEPEPQPETTPEPPRIESVEPEVVVAPIVQPEPEVIPPAIIEPAVEAVEPVVVIPEIVIPPVALRTAKPEVRVEPQPPAPVVIAEQPPMVAQRLVVVGLTEVDASTILANGANFQRVSRLQVVKAQLVCNWAGL